MSEEPKRGRGRPPGSKNKTRPRERPKSARVEARKRQAKAKAAAVPIRPAPRVIPPIVEVQAEIVLPGEGFGERPGGDDLPNLGEDDKQLAFVWPRPRGRRPGSTILQPDAITLDRIWRVGWEQGSQAVLATALGVSSKTLQRFFDAHEIARDTFTDALAAGKGRLNIEVFRQAMSGENTPALIHAHKVWGDGSGAPIPGLGGDGEPKKLQRIVIELVDAQDSAS